MTGTEWYVWLRKTTLDHTEERPAMIYLAIPSGV